MITRLLSKTEKEIFGADLLVVVQVADVALAGNTTAVVVPLVTVPAGTKVKLEAAKLVTSFDNGATGGGGAAITVGVSGAAASMMASSKVGADDAPVVYPPLTDAPVVAVADTAINVTFTPASVNTNTFTTGEMAFYLRVDDLTKLAIR